MAQSILFTEASLTALNITSSPVLLVCYFATLILPGMRQGDLLACFAAHAYIIFCVLLFIGLILKDDCLSLIQLPIHACLKKLVLHIYIVKKHLKYNANIMIMILVRA